MANLPDKAPVATGAAGTPVAGATGGKAQLSQEQLTTDSLWSRRDVLAWAGWAAVLGSIMVGILSWVRMMYPRVLFEPPTQFKVGFPTEYSVGEVSTKWVQAYRVWIVREKEGFYALIAICTHLGCTPLWLPAEDKFKCPCHGSGYHRDGVNFEGPTPRPLERAKITLAEDGQILVDKGVSFRWELGQWSKPDAFLKLKA